MSAVNSPISERGWRKMKNFNTMRSFLHITIFNILFSCITVLPSTLILRNADYNRNTFTNGRLISVLKGNVEFKYEDIIINADEATWYRGKGRVHFRKNIRVTMKQQLLTCERMDYDRAKKKLVVRKNVDFFDHEKQMRIVSQKAVYSLDTKRIVLTKDPQLFRYDTTIAETLIITGDKMIYDDSLDIAIAEKDVSILKGLLKSRCQTATYYVETGIAKLRTDPWIYYDVHDVTGDSVDLFFIDETLRGVSVMRNAKGYHRDVTPEDTIFTNVTGDSLYMDISDSGFIQTIWTYDDATTLYYSSKTPESVNEANGKVIVLHFTHGTTGTLTISGNAESVYYLEDEKESGRNEASGDKIRINFVDGKAEFIKIHGGVRGTYFAETIEGD
jgi:lipopolysaccharide export system protein LptA